MEEYHQCRANPQNVKSSGEYPTGFSMVAPFHYSLYNTDQNTDLMVLTTAGHHNVIAQALDVVAEFAKCLLTVR